MGAVEITSAVADAFTAIATCGAVFVASQGLQAWRKELKGRADFDGARELAKSTYALRDALSAYRSPLWSSHEFPDGDMKSPDGHAAMFQSRWRQVGDALVKFDLATLEAEALWGVVAREQASQLSKCVNTLFAATQAFLGNLRANGEDFKASPEFGQRIRAQVTRIPPEETNELSQEIGGAVAGIEELLRPHLSRG